MRIFRIAAVLVGALLALVVVAVAALLLFVDPNRYRGDIERVAREHTGRVLAIHGKLELKIFPWLALAVHGVQLGNREGFGSEPFLTVQKASIGVKLLPLLGKRLEVSRIALEGVNVNLVTRGAQNNWSDFSESKAPSESAPGGPPSLGSVSIEGVSLSKSAVVYRDETRKSTIELANLELHSGRLETGGSRTALANLELQGTWLARTAAQGLPRTTEQKPAGDLKPAGELKPLAFSLSTSGLALDTAAQTLAPAKMTVKVGDFALLVTMSGEKMSTERLVTGSLTVPPTSARKLLQSLGIAPPVTRDSHAFSAFGLETNFRLTRKQLQLAPLQVTLDETRIRGTAAIEDLDRSALSFDLNVNGINVDRYRAPAQAPAARKVSPPASSPPTTLPVETLRKLDVHGTLRVGSATFAGLTFTDAVMPLVAKDGQIRLGPTQARLYGGSYNGDIVLDARPAEAQLSLNQHMQGTDIGAIVKAAFDSARLSGRADANVALTGVGSTDEAIIRSLNGKIDANVKQGALIGIDIVYELQRVNALLKQELPPPQRTGQARTVFNTLQTNGTLDKAVLRIDALRLETDFLQVRGRGTLDTTTEAINYQLVAVLNKLPAGGSAVGGGGGPGALTAVEVPLSVTGTMSSPTVRPDIEALAKGRLGHEVQQKAGELVKKKMGDKLKDLFGH